MYSFLGQAVWGRFLLDTGSIEQLFYNFQSITSVNIPPHSLSLFALFLITCYFHSEFCPTQPLIKQGILQARETTRSITEERMSMVTQAREARTDGQRNQEVEEEAC